MSPRCSKSHHRGDVGKVEELFVGLESDEELEAALLREISELSGSDQPLGPGLRKTLSTDLLRICLCPPESRNQGLLARSPNDVGQARQHAGLR